MKKSRITVVSLVALVTGMVLGGCKRENETPGQALDRTLDTTADAARTAADETKVVGEKVVDKTGELVEKSGEALDKTGEKMQE